MTKVNKFPNESRPMIWYFEKKIVFRKIKLIFDLKN